jgi:hypothetical protein
VFKKNVRSRLVLKCLSLSIILRKSFLNFHSETGTPKKYNNQRPVLPKAGYFIISSPAPGAF